MDGALLFFELNTWCSSFYEHPKNDYSKTCLKRPLKKKTKIGFQDRLSLNAGKKYCRMLPLEHSAILSTFNKQPFVLSIFEWLLKTGFTVVLTLSMLDADLSGYN